MSQDAAAVYASCRLVSKRVKLSPAPEPGKTMTPWRSRTDIANITTKEYHAKSCHKKCLLHSYQVDVYHMYCIMYICIYVYICVCVSLSLSLSPSPSQLYRIILIDVLSWGRHNMTLTSSLQAKRRERDTWESSQDRPTWRFQRQQHTSRMFKL